LALTRVYLVQHADKAPTPGDPGLTQRGRGQAARTGQWLVAQAGVAALFSSPLRRAVETAQVIATTTSLPMQHDLRLRERMNWDGKGSIQTFLTDWARATRDRDFIPPSGDSSRQAGARLRAFLLEVGSSGLTAVVAVTHGGITLDLLRSLLGDQAVPADLLESGVPSCAITTLDDLRVVEIASTAHLAD
jgi:broad specificity phosphatase PhoE